MEFLIVSINKDVFIGSSIHPIVEEERLDNIATEVPHGCLTYQNNAITPKALEP